jgi:hypothetical protein
MYFVKKLETSEEITIPDLSFNIEDRERNDNVENSKASTVKHEKSKK